MAEGVNADTFNGGWCQCRHVARILRMDNSQPVQVWHLQYGRRRAAQLRPVHVRPAQGGAN